MDFKVIITGPAKTDLGDIVKYIAKDNATAAAKVGGKLIEKAEMLGEFPFIGSKSRDVGMEDCRVLVVAPYWIVCRVVQETKTVEVFRFWHPSRGTPRIYTE